MFFLTWHDRCRLRFRHGCRLRPDVPRLKHAGRFHPRSGRPLRSALETLRRNVRRSHTTLAHRSRTPKRGSRLLAKLHLLHTVHLLYGLRWRRLLLRLLLALPNEGVQHFAREAEHVSFDSICRRTVRYGGVAVLRPTAD